MLKKIIILAIFASMFGCATTKPSGDEYTQPAEARQILMENIEHANKIMPMKINDSFTITKFSESASNSLELVMDTTVTEDFPENITPKRFLAAEKINLQNGICSGAMQGFAFIIHKGITLTAAFKTKTGEDIGKVSINDQVCKPK